MPEELVEKMISLKWIHSGQAGIDAMPRALLERMGVVVTNSRGINSVTIAEYVISMLLNLARNNAAFYRAQREKRWDMETKQDELAGKTIGIAGLGMVGREIAKRAKAFDMTVYGMNMVPVELKEMDRQFLPDGLHEMLPCCDYVVSCLPLTEQTKHLFSSPEFRLMKQTAVMVNVGRGPVVREADLIKALADGEIYGAVLDVFEQEPLPAGSPLWDMEHVIVTPHIAGDRQLSYMPRMMDILCRNLSRYPELAQMENQVDLRLGF